MEIERRRSYDADVDRIGKSIEYLSVATRELSVNQQKQINRVQRHTSVLMILFVICAALLVALSYIGHRSDENSEKIDVLQERTNRQVLCSLYSVFLNSYSEASIAAQENLALYRNAFAEIEKGASLLHCSQTTRRQP